MLVLNGTERAQRDNIFFTRPTSQLDNTRSSNCIRKKKKKLSASNVTFLKSLGFAVRNI